MKAMLYRMEFLLAALFVVCLVILQACSEEKGDPLFPEDEVAEQMEIELKGWTVDSLSLKNQVIYISPTKSWMDSLVVDTVSLAGCSALYLAADSDLVDPELGEKLMPGTVISTADTNQFSIVALDSYNRIVGVWLVTWKLPKEASQESSSSAKKGDSSSSEKGSSSSAKKASSSSSEAKSSSSSVKESDPVEESSSSSEAESSSSEVVTSSSSVVKLSELSVEDGTIEVSESKVYVEVPYGTDLSAIQLSPLDTTSNLIRPVEMEFEDEQGNVATYSVVAGVQLPGSDFSARNDFWATTSDAMGVSKTAALIKISSEANLDVADGKATITTCGVGGSFIGIGASSKMAGGFYFAGTYAGTTALDIYEQGYTSGTPSTEDSYIINDMTFGKDFTARPTAFKIRYSYSHVANSSTDYPQKSLVYVMLVGAGNKVVATGAISDSVIREMEERTVELNYGSDPFGLLTGGYAVAEGLSLGTGDEDVTSIHVMFASSAYAHVVGGGVSAEDKYRGGDGAALVLDDFKLIY